MALPVINLDIHQRTALDHLRDTQTYTLVAYANNQLALDNDFEYARPLAKIEVDRPYIYAGSQQEWRGEILSLARRKALDLHIPHVWRSVDGEICGDYYEN